mmetsp:Transcript_3882/g.9057  ORF Transcript_3882/g.9057 Transcript_3882/m.9057 type:complete len:117 (-) Transcript_3882:96-446(-)
MCELNKKYKSRGLEILGFPCNQFGGQEPGTAPEVQAFAKSKCPESPVTVFGKIEVNGAGEDPLFTFLKAEKGGGLLGDDIPWNFGKFLVNRKGEVVARFGPQQSPKSFEDDIVALI